MPSIDAIEGIGHTSATRLRKARIRTTEALLRKGATRTDRKRLATATGFTEQQILAWVNRADVMRVKGIGAEYSVLLEAAGVDTVKELKLRKPAPLHAKMLEIHNQKNLVRRLPTEPMVAAWIAAAMQLPAVIKS